MKRMFSLLAATLLVLSLAPAAFATDGIGVYLDEAGTINCSAAPITPYTPVTLYLVAKNISSTASGLSGWECSLIYEPATFVLPPSYTIRNNMTNLLLAPVFLVGGFPAAYQDAIPLANITLVYTGDPIKVGIGPCIPSSFGGASGAYPDVPPGPGYAVGDNPGDLRRFYPSSNVESGTPLYYWVYYLGINEPCPGSPVGAQESSWGAVKSLFK